MKEVLILTQDAPGDVSIRSCRVYSVKTPDAFLDRALAGELDTLWSAPGVEVDEDFKNAIFLAEEHMLRFTETQLHQLLGRFGQDQRTNTVEELAAAAWETSLTNSIRLIHPEAHQLEI